MQSSITLDVTSIEPKLQHTTIFEKFDQLGPEESLIINNDHDPKPLYYQLLGEMGNEFSWDYLENGPDVWKVKITKNSSNENKPTIGEIVAKDYRKAEVFKKYNIDFCCGGKKTVSQACANKKLNPLDVENELNQLDAPTATLPLNFDEWDLDFLVDYILQTHHKYVEKNIPILIDFTMKVSRVHGVNHPKVITIAEKFREVAFEMVNHMNKEEAILFPYIKKMAQELKNGNRSPLFAQGSVQNPIAQMEHEHEVVGDLFKSIRELSDNYTPPAGACTTFKVSYLKLKEFEEDLHQHIHLENNILFPKSLLFEKKTA